jgi:hypothetical protein
MQLPDLDSSPVTQIVVWFKKQTSGSYVYVIIDK